MTTLAGDLTISSQDAKTLLAALPEDLDPERKAVVETACRLVGKVNYFWGGKSRVVGWDEQWGQIKKVTASGSSTSGTYRPFGLDCSGFVDWVFYNVTGGSYIIGHGGGAHSQHGYCTAITWDQAIPGDLVFYPGDTHVGIVGGRNESGNLLIIHCTNNYTVMSNYHLRDKTLSLKAKGLLYLMLLLPETWDYTLSGLARISLEGKDAIRTAMVELMVEAVCSRKETIRVAGNDFHQAVVKSRLLKLDRQHIRFVFDCLRENTTQVRNMNQYLLMVVW